MKLSLKRVDFPFLNFRVKSKRLWSAPIEEKTLKFYSLQILLKIFYWGNKLKNVGLGKDLRNYRFKKKNTLGITA